MVAEGKTFVDAGKLRHGTRKKYGKLWMIPRSSMRFSGTSVLSRHWTFSNQSPRTTEFSKLWRASESAHTMGRAMITRRLRGNTSMLLFRTAHRSLIYAHRICAGHSRMAVTVTITPRGLIRAYAHGIARRTNLFGFQLAAIGFASTSVIRIRKEEIAAHVARSRQKGEKNMLFRSNCIRPVYAVYGKDEGDHTVVIAYVHEPNQINKVRSMLFLEHEEVVFTEVRIETMKFEGWKVIG